MEIRVPDRAFNKCYLPLLNEKRRYIVLYGGAGSGKSYFAASRYVLKLIGSGKCNILCVRNTGVTNRDSTFALMKQIISKWGLERFFKILDGELRIKCLVNDNEAVFKGLDDAEKLKSITFARGELTDIWIEEASEITKEDFDRLDLRLRGGKSDKQIVLTFNPIDVNHWLKKRFFDEKPKDAVVLHTTYKDNRFLDEGYKKLLESYKNADPYLYSVYCLGQWGVYGKTVFNANAISERLSELKPPEAVGIFECDLDEVKICNIRFLRGDDGCIKIFKFPKKNRPYVIGGDTAGEGSDYFVAQVLDNVTGEQVATLRSRFDEDVYATQMYCLGKFYNDALIGIESNFSTYPIRELARYGYPRQYIREREDTFTGAVVRAYGFKTTLITRPVILAELIKITREHIHLINDEQTLHEMLTFVRSEKGRPEAKAGAHDDLIMALAIAYYIRPQQDMTVKNISPSPFFQFEFMKPKKGGVGKGDEITVI